MGDGWTGIGLSEARADLDSFRHTMMELINIYANGFDELNETMYNCWASPNAKKFNDMFLKPLAEVETELASLATDVLTSATQAAQDVAKSNGASFIYEVPPLTANGEVRKTLLEEKDGKTGMNIPMVKVSVDNFLTTCSTIKENLHNIPMGFALLDPQNELLTAYQNRIKGLSEKITLLITTLSLAMENCYTAEELDLNLGKQQASQELSGKQN